MALLWGHLSSFLYKTQLCLLGAKRRNKVAKDKSLFINWVCDWNSLLLFAPASLVNPAWPQCLLYDRCSDVGSLMRHICWLHNVLPIACFHFHSLVLLPPTVTHSHFVSGVILSGRHPSSECYRKKTRAELLTAMPQKTYASMTCQR